MGVFLFTFILLISQSRKLMDLVVVGNISGMLIIKMILCIIPSFLVVTLPVTILLAGVMAFGRMSSDCEITSMLASGITIKDLSKPIIFLSILGSSLTLLLNTVAVPRANTILREIVMDNIQKTLTSNIQEGIFNDRMGDIVLYIKKFERKNNKFHGIFIADYRTGERPTTVFAKEGVINVDPLSSKLKLLLLNGSIQLSDKKNKKRLGYIEFKKYSLDLDLERFFHKRRKKFKSRREWSIERLRLEIAKAKKAGKEYLPMKVELIKKISLPISCFILGMLSIPLGINTDRGGKMSGFPKAIALFVIYYILWNAFENLGKTGILNPYLSLWVPNILIGSFGIILFLRADKISTNKSSEIFERIKDKIKKVKR